MLNSFEITKVLEVSEISDVRLHYRAVVTKAVFFILA